MQEKTKVLVARAARDLATILLKEDSFVGFAGDDDEPIVGTADMQLVPSSQGNITAKDKSLNKRRLPRKGREG